MSWQNKNRTDSSTNYGHCRNRDEQMHTTLTGGRRISGCCVWAGAGSAAVVCGQVGDQRLLYAGRRELWVLWTLNTNAGAGTHKDDPEAIRLTQKQEAEHKVWSTRVLTA